VNLNNKLIHPAIVYHYADDPPRSLVPQQDEHVLVLDHDPSGATPIVQSISPAISVTGLRIEEAPGAATESSDDRMFIVDATATTTQDRPMESSISERKPPHAVLAQFKQRNAELRRSLLYPPK